MRPSACLDTGHRDRDGAFRRGQNREIEHPILFGAYQLLPVQQQYSKRSPQTAIAPHVII